MARINKIIRILIQADVIFLSAFGFITPIFAVFVTEQIKGGDVRVVGFAAAIYWILKSILQIPISKFLDKKKGEKDDLYFMITGFLIATIIPFGWLLASLPWHIYMLEAIYSVGMALAVPSWYAIFTRHIDKGKEAFDWAAYSTSIGVGTGVTGAVGGILVSKFGFDAVFIIVGILAFLGSLSLFLIRKDVSVRGNGYLRFFRFLKPPLG